MAWRDAAGQGGRVFRNFRTGRNRGGRGKLDGLWRWRRRRLGDGRFHGGGRRAGSEASFELMDAVFEFFQVVQTRLKAVERFDRIAGADCFF
jgi:hypothetical protein